MERLGEKEYDIYSNNCEHFAMRCKFGVGVSIQIKNIAIGAVLVIGAVVIMIVALPVVIVAALAYDRCE